MLIVMVKIYSSFLENKAFLDKRVDYDDDFSHFYTGIIII